MAIELLPDFSLLALHCYGLVMAINAYVGLPGSGKSYGVIENVILPALRDGRPVFTNIPMNLASVGADFDIELLFPLANDDLKKSGAEFWLGIPGGAVIVLDEVWRIWPAGLKAADIPDYQKEFLAEHRHKTGLNGLTQEIVLVVQDLAQIANYVRGLVDTTYVAVKLDKVGAKNKYRIDVYPGSQKGPNYPKNPLSAYYGAYKKEVYKYYISHTKTETGLPGMERVLDNRATIWRHPMIRFGLPVAVVVFYFAFSSLYRFFTGGTLAHSKAIQPAQNTVQPVENLPSNENVVKSVPQKPLKAEVKPVSPYSVTWRIQGYSGSNGQYVYLLAHVVKGHRRVSSEHCRVESYEPVCDLDGELVTPWTGQINKLMGQTASRSVDDVKQQLVQGQ